MQNISWVWWRVPVISVTQEAEAGELPEPRRRRLRWAEMAPLHSSLGNKSETPYQKKKDQHDALLLPSTSSQNHRFNNGKYSPYLVTMKNRKDSLQRCFPILKLLIPWTKKSTTYPILLGKSKTTCLATIWRGVNSLSILSIWVLVILDRFKFNQHILDA